MNFFSSILYMMLERIGKSSNQMSQQQQQHSDSNASDSPNSQAMNTIFTGHQPLSMELISSFTLHVRMQ